MSSDLAIRAEHLSKDYVLGLTGRRTSLVHLLGARLRHPIRGAGARRDRFRALDDLSFEVAAGEVVGIVGRNGAGKSTLLKILSRITFPTRGHVDLFGSVGSLLEVGTGFHPELTGLENVYLNGAILGMTRREIDARLDEIVAFAEVDRFLETPVKRYSSGMRVRLAFAVAAHLEPEILIIDEVLSVGDAAFQAKCLDKMRTVAADDGRTVLYVSHNLVTVENLCPRSLLIDQGRLDFDGPSDQAIQRYLGSLPHAERESDPGVFNLRNADRSSAGFETVLTRLVLRPGGGAPGSSLGIGDSLQIAIDVENYDTIRGAGMIVTVGSSTTDCLFRMTSRAVAPRFADERRTHETIVIDIPSLPLTPGEYHVDVEVGEDPRFGRGTVDGVRRAAEFTVVATDVLGNGHRFGAHDGYFVVPWDWEVRPRVEDPAAVGAVQGTAHGS